MNKYQIDKYHINNRKVKTIKWTIDSAVAWNVVQRIILYTHLSQFG